MNLPDLLFIANGLAGAADAIAMMLIVIGAMVIGLIGFIAMGLQSLRALHVQLGLLALFGLLFQPWRYWLFPPVSPATDPEFESANDVIALSGTCGLVLVLFAIVTAVVTVIHLGQTRQIEEELGDRFRS